MSTAVLRQSHIFERDEHDHFVEPQWCSKRLFEVEDFVGPILDPACGWGNVLRSALAHGYSVIGSDIVDRRTSTGIEFPFIERDFLRASAPDPQPGAIVSNPPFKDFEAFAHRALALCCDVAFLWQVRRLPAARWLRTTPLKRIWLLTPRPSCPSGQHILDGGKVGGGTADYCWCIWRRGYQGEPSIGWLHRDQRPQG